MTTTKTWIKRTDRNPTPDDTNDHGAVGVWKPGMTFMAYSSLNEFLMSKDLTHFYPLEKSPALPTVEPESKPDIVQQSNSWQLVWSLITSLPVFNHNHVASAPTGAQAAINAIQLLAEDASRLSWLEENGALINDVHEGHVNVHDHHYYGSSYRAAIDTARRYHQ